jgi:hypothetical protein
MTMTNITAEAAVEALWLAFEFEPIGLDEIFDAIAVCLHRHPRFAGMTLFEVDLLLADIRCKTEYEVGELESKVAGAFRDALFDVADGVRA